MDLKQKYREETNLEPYGDIDQKDNYTRHYVKWLEKQCTIPVVQKELEKIIIKALENNGQWYETWDCVHRIIERRNFDRVAKEVATKILNVL